MMILHQAGMWKWQGNLLLPLTSNMNGQKGSDQIVFVCVYMEWVCNK